MTNALHYVKYFFVSYAVKAMIGLYIMYSVKYLNDILFQCASYISIARLLNPNSHQIFSHSDALQLPHDLKSLYSFIACLIIPISSLCWQPIKSLYNLSFFENIWPGSIKLARQTKKSTYKPILIFRMHNKVKHNIVYSCNTDSVAWNKAHWFIWRDGYQIKSISVVITTFFIYVNMCHIFLFIL